MELEIIHEMCCRNRNCSTSKHCKENIVSLGCRHNMQPNKLSFWTGGRYNARLLVLTCCLYYSFQNHHNFKLICLHGPLGEVVEGAFGVNHMADREWGDEEELVCPSVETHVQLQLIQWKKLALGRLARLRKRTGKDRDGDVEWGRKGGRQTYLQHIRAFVGDVHMHMQSEQSLSISEKWL